MARHDGTPNTFWGFGDPHGDLDVDNWPDAPDQDDDPTGDAGLADDEPVDGYETPAYDLGPQTESFTIDLSDLDPAPVPPPVTPAVPPPPVAQAPAAAQPPAAQPPA
ncbi:MAG: hypothetical protein ACRDV1_08885, partial [Actinomycetes bacterium]